MTVKELFPQVIKNYEYCIEAISTLRNRDNIFREIEIRNCEGGICNHIINVYEIRKPRRIGELLGLKYFLQMVCPIPSWTYTKEKNIELLQTRISAMKKALELYPDEEI